MAIDIFRKGEKRNRVFSISDELYKTLNASAIDCFEGKAGVFIDEYGKSRLSFQHSNLLLKMLRKGVEERRIKPIAIVNQFLDFLEKVVNEQIDLDLVGD